MASIPKLTYFPLGGRATAIRNAFKYGKLDFVDQHVTYQEQQALKAEGAYTFGAVPVLEYQGVQYSQSNAILRWVGKQAGLYPEDPLLAFRADEVLDVAEDISHAVGITMREQDLEKKIALRKELLAKELTTYFRGLEKLLERNNSEKGWFVGDKPTIADFKINPVFWWLTSGLLDGIPKDIFDTYPLIQKNIAAYNELAATL